MSIGNSEKVFMLEGFQHGIRTDGRGIMDCRQHTTFLGTVPEAYGSCTLTFGEDDTQVVCAIKAEVMKPLPSEPDMGQITLYLESCQTGRSLFVREDQADLTKQRMLNILNTLMKSCIDRRELCIMSGQFCWFLHIDLLVFSELSFDQIDYIALCMRSALGNLELPQTIATVNNNTGKIEVGLVEEVYMDKENTDAPLVLKSQEHCPYVISLGVVRPRGQKTPVIVLDPTEVELQCVDQVLHFAVDRDLKIHGLEQSKGSQSSDGSESLSLGLPSSLFLKTNLKAILEHRVRHLSSK